MNLLFFRIEAWLLCNDNGLQSSFPKMLNVQKDKIPDMITIALARPRSASGNQLLIMNPASTSTA